LDTRFWVDKIRVSYRSTIPDGYALGWSEDRYLAALKKRLPDYQIDNFTSFDYAVCNTYELNVQAELRSYIATLKISFIVDCYVLYIGHLKRISASDAQTHFAPIAKSIHQLLDGGGFQEIQTEVLDVVVPGVTLNLAPQATIGKCLFDDYE